MGHLRFCLSLMLFLVAINDAAELTGREYWKSVLPKSPMPNAISAVLNSGTTSMKTISPGESKVAPRCSISLSYSYGCHAQLRDDPNFVNPFFLEKDLHVGTIMTMHFTKSMPNPPNFIPRSEADKIPFSSFKFSDILDRFKIQKDSSLAELMKETLNECEMPAIIGEKKYCATSLESMVDFATSSLRTHDVRAVSTNVNFPNAPKQEYTIIQLKRYLVERNELVTCHSRAYAYAVFYCHMNKSAKLYMVNLVGKAGDKVDAIVVCHMDTSSWNPKHLAFQLLKVRPGTVPICHFLPQDHVVWTRNSS